MGDQLAKHLSDETLEAVAPALAPCYPAHPFSTSTGLSSDCFPDIQEQVVLAASEAGVPQRGAWATCPLPVSHPRVARSFLVQAVQLDSAPSPPPALRGPPSTVVSVWFLSVSFLKSESPGECFLGFKREEVGWE